ncbi:SGNH/GDSL hydrolase family protein [Bacillus sp. NPDC093026]|uniref:SGNH/GDSL hydrolase family protein n=1 Tax=Bacillus sp. NPDC093026 TaxID=3363948 RepID=UPI00382A19C2
MKKCILLFMLICVVNGCSKPVHESIIAFGDSNTRGSNWDFRDYPTSEKWVNLIKNGERGEIQVMNAGIGGQTTEDAKLRFEQDILNQKPTYVFIMFGTNDAAILDGKHPRVTKKRFKENLSYFISESRKEGIIPILMTCVPIVEGGKKGLYYYSRYKPSYFTKRGGARAWQNSYNDITREVAKEQNVPLVDNWKAFIQKAGENSDRALIQSGLIDPSGNHMTPKGARIIYNEIKERDVMKHF